MKKSTRPTKAAYHEFS